MTGVLEGKRVVLTGASTGIGEQMAYHYASHKSNLLITARRENLLKKASNFVEIKSKYLTKYQNLLNTWKTNSPG